MIFEEWKNQKNSQRLINYLVYPTAEENAAPIFEAGENEALKKLATVICNNVGIGISATAILAFCTGVENKSMYPPYDADDFKRCHNLLSAFPEWKDKLKDIGKTHKAWGTVGEHWLEIEEAYLKKDYEAVYDMLTKYRHEVSE